MDKLLGVTNDPPKKIEVILKDIQMDISSMAIFMVKWAIATIPAAVILLIVIGLAASLIKGCARL